MPGKYGFIKEESTAYEDGTGVDNEDELEDIRQEQIRKAEEAKREEEERRRKYVHVCICVCVYVSSIL